MRKSDPPEILAPAGTYEAMEAAIKAGCDAIYAGGSLFSARAYAGNFDEAAFLRAIDHCHLFGVKVYMTVNTLLKEAEIKGSFNSGTRDALIRYLTPYYRAGLDAVIIQDLGVLKILREHFPDLAVHASTQMSISSVYGVKLAEQLGLERIVPARELSLKELVAIKENSDIEIETFVHGAMCFAYSGKCLFSSFAGGRSGNRGRCAQPCRQCYQLLSTEGNIRAKEYLLSLKDMCTLEELPYLIDAGIDSFKIEGRMKNPSYVASAVRAYRTATDLYLNLKQKDKAENYDGLSKVSQDEYASLAKDLIADLRDIYNRGGFYSGYYFTDKGREMAALRRPNHLGLKIGTVVSVKPPKIAIRLEEELHSRDVLELRRPEDRQEKVGGSASTDTPVELTSGTGGSPKETVWINGKELKKIRPGMEVWRTRNPHLLAKIEEEILKPEKTVSADCRIYAKKGEPLSILLTAFGRGKNGEDISAYVKGAIIEKADKAPTSAASLKEKMKKSCGSKVTISGIDCEAEDDIFVPMSAFNVLRRNAAEELLANIAATYHRVKEPEGDGFAPMSDLTERQSSTAENQSADVHCREENVTIGEARKPENHRTEMCGNRSATGLMTLARSKNLSFEDGIRHDDLLTLATAKELNLENGIRHDDLLTLATAKELNLEDGFRHDGLIVRVRTMEQMKSALSFHSVNSLILDYGCDLPDPSHIKKDYPEKKVYLQLPDVLRENRSDSVRRLAEEAFLYDGIVIKNFDELGLLEDLLEERKVKDDWKIIGDSFLYAYNSEASAFLQSRFPEMTFILPDELTDREIAELMQSSGRNAGGQAIDTGDSVEISQMQNAGRDAGGRERFMFKIYGHQPLMITHQCLGKNYTDCHQKLLRFTDDKKHGFYAVSECRQCYSLIYNGQPTSMLDKTQRSGGTFLVDGRKYDAVLLDFTIEPGAEVTRILNGFTEYIDLSEYESRSEAFRDLLPSITRGHHYRNVE